MAPPWQTRSGQFSALKFGVFIALFLPAVWLGLRWGGIGPDLGPRRLMETIHRTGDWAVRFWLISLAITPLRHLFRAAPIVQVRRMVGVAVFAYAALHFALYIVDLSGNLVKVATEIYLRFYLTIGFAALLGLAAMAATSTDGMLRRLGGRAWRALHRLTYPLAFVALVHFGLQSKLDVSEPMVMTGLLLWVLLLRWPKARGGWALLPGVIGVVLATAGLEALWYSLRSGAPLMAVLSANFSTGLGVRPTHWVLILTGSVALAALAWQARPGVVSRGNSRTVRAARS